ncbi:MAG: DUF3226 domain-containing protein [Kiritimatiellia bacterium]
MVEGIERALVLCEGPEDRRVVECLLEQIGAENVEVEAFNGKDNLRSKLDEVKNSPEFAQGIYSKILVTRDADADWSAAWQSVRDAVEAKFDIRLEDVNQWGSINEDTQVAAWIFPGKEQTGMIETLCLEVARDTQPEVFECLDQYAACLRSKHQADLHHKERFAIWTIAAQTFDAPRRRLSMGRILKNLTFDWSNEKFSETRAILSGITSKP